MCQIVSQLQPVFSIRYPRPIDGLLNLFRGVVPPIGGIDISPIGAFFVLNLLTNAVASLGATSTPIKVVPQQLPGMRVVKRLRQEFAQ